MNLENPMLGTVEVVFFSYIRIYIEVQSKRIPWVYIQSVVPEPMLNTRDMGIRKTCLGVIFFKPQLETN